jgi:hypothetical protein
MATATSNRSRSTRATQPGGSNRRRAAGASRVKAAKGPALASGAAVAGLAAGTVLGSRLRGRRRPRVLGVPMPRSSEVKSGFNQAARAGRWVAGMQADVRAVRAQAAQSRRQSPIEVVLSALTSRRLPRHDQGGVD